MNFRTKRYALLRDSAEEIKYLMGFHLADRIKNNFTKAVGLLELNFAKKIDSAPRKKYFSLFFVAVAAIVIGSMLYAHPASADAGDWIVDIVLKYLIYPLIYIIFYVLFYIAWVVAWIGANIISINLNPAIINTVLTHPAVYEGWKIFRDVANLLFILILLLIALGTIFRSSSYNIKKSLYQFIIIIFLINFSFMIAGLFIDFGNILMYGVLKGMCASGTETCFQDSFYGLMNVIDKFGDEYTLGKMVSFSGIQAQQAVGMAVATIYTFVYGLILMGLGLFLMIRVVALAILLILAPLAFFGYTAPGLKGFKDKWWDNLIQYVMFGPVFALMLYITGHLAVITIDTPSGAITSVAALGSIGTLISTVIINIIPLIFLLAIIPVTRAFGIAGSGVILGGISNLGYFAGGALVGAWSQSLARGQFIPGSSWVSKKVGSGARVMDTKLFGGRGGRFVGGVKTKVSTTAGRVKTRASAWDAAHMRGYGGKTVGAASGARTWAEKQAFGETKSLGDYKGMLARSMSVPLVKKSIAQWMRESEQEAYKIPLGTKPDEKKKIQMLEDSKRVNELKAAGGFDNPAVVSDNAAREIKEGNFGTFMILTKLLAAQDKQYNVLKSMQRITGVDYTNGGTLSNADAWGKFLVDFGDKVGEDRASIFGQEVGNAARREGDWTASEIAYYDEKTGEHKIRNFNDAAVAADPITGAPILHPVTRAPMTKGEVARNEYVAKNAEAMGKKDIRTKWHNMSSENFGEKLAAPVRIVLPTGGGLTAPLNIQSEYKLNRQGTEYINKYITPEEINEKVKNNGREELRKIREAVAYDLQHNVAAFTTSAAKLKAEKLVQKITDVLG